MKPQEQFPVPIAIKNALNGYRYTPGKPDDTEMVNRLAVKSQAAAIEFGEDLAWDDAVKRARHNLAYVKALAGARGGVKESEWKP